MKLTLKEKQLVKEYAKKLQSKKLNEGYDTELINALEDYGNDLVKLTRATKNRIKAWCKKNNADRAEAMQDFKEHFVEVSEEVERIILELF